MWALNAKQNRLFMFLFRRGTDLYLVEQCVLSSISGMIDLFDFAAICSWAVGKFVQFSVYSKIRKEKLKSVKKKQQNSTNIKTNCHQQRDRSFFKI